MQSVVAERSRSRARPVRSGRAPLKKGPGSWWGDGPPPSERWPGVTIELSPVWSKARGRWELGGGLYYFDTEAADYAQGFFPTFLRHHIGEFDGQAFEPLPYQRYLLRAMFGWKRASDGLRRFRKVFLAVPKGNGKSPFCSGLGLFLAFFDHEPGAEAYAVAADKKQARIVFDTSKVMVEKSPDLRDLCEVYTDSIKLKGSTESYQVLSSDASTKHGFRPHAILFDEYHAQPSRDLSDALMRGMGKRRQPLLIMVTTAGDDDESICFEEWDYGRRVVSGSVIDPTYLPMIFEASEKDDWSKEEIWRRVNPGFGITIKKDYFISESSAAQVEPRKRNSFIQMHTNRWTNSAVAWIPVEWWDACRGDFTDEQLRLLSCAAGLDMAQKIDLAAFSVVFKEPLKGKAPEVLEVAKEGTHGKPVIVEVSLNFRLYAKTFFWLPEETARDRAREGFDSYLRWGEMGLLTLTEGAVIDYDRIFKDVTEKIVPRFPLLKQGRIGYDPAFATDIANRLRDKAGLTTVEVLQNYQHISEPCQIFEGLVKSKRLVHDGNALLRWNAENVAIKRDDAGRIRPVKPKKPGKKIDGIVATLMGLGQIVLQPDPKKSIYEGRMARGEELVRHV